MISFKEFVNEAKKISTKEDFIDTLIKHWNAKEEDKDLYTIQGNKGKNDILYVDFNPDSQSIIEIAPEFSLYDKGFDSYNKAYNYFMKIMAKKSSTPTYSYRVIFDKLNGKQKQKISEIKQRYEIYHKSFTSAWDEVKSYVAKQGYQMDEGDVESQVTFGGTTGRARPSTGKTNKFDIRLEKDGKPTKKIVHFQVYALPNSYELNMYIS